MSALLHALTNRGSGFASPSFPRRSSYVAKAETETTAHVRTLLGLDRRDTDYFVHAALQLMYGDSHVLQMPLTYDDALVTYAPPPAALSQGTLQPWQATPPAVLRVANEWPVQFQMVITPMDATTARVTCGALSEVVTVLVNTTQALVAWPTWTGVAGVIDGVSWPICGAITIHHTPLRFPLSILQQQLLADNMVQDLLRRQQLEVAFHRTSDPARAVILVLSALANTTYLELT